jgi:hypothetical protein
MLALARCRKEDVLIFLLQCFQPAKTTSLMADATPCQVQSVRRNPRDGCHGRDRLQQAHVLYAIKRFGPAHICSPSHEPSRNQSMERYHNHASSCSQSSMLMSQSAEPVVCIAQSTSCPTMPSGTDIQVPLLTVTSSKTSLRAQVSMKSEMRADQASRKHHAFARTTLASRFCRTGCSI